MSYVDTINTWKQVRPQKYRGALLSLSLCLGILLLLPRQAEALHKIGEKWPNREIPVCWRSDAFGHSYHESHARMVKDIMENNWGRVADIRFTGWGVCPGAPMSEPNGTIAIHWEDDDVNKGPRADIGYYSDKRTFIRLVPIDPNATDRAEAEARFQADVLHEFGHALGFAHEMDRPDNPNTRPCGCWGTPIPGDSLGTPFDQASIMTWTYCGNPPGRLSPWDIVGVQNLYGRKRAGSVVGLNNRALDLPGGAIAIGTELQVFNYHGNTNQSWARGLDGSLRVDLWRGLAHIIRCADVPGGVIYPSSGAILQSYYCHSGANQKFTFENVEIRGIGDKCLVVPSGSYFDGQSVQLYNCNGGANQKWTIEPNGQIKAGSSGYCLDVPDGTADSGKLLQLYHCHDGASQKFTTTSLGEIKFGGLCVDSQEGDPVNGRKIQLYTCTPDGPNKRNQQWHLSGPIRGLGGQCLDIRGGIATDQAKAQLYPCHGGANQTWDYYFK